MSQMPPGQDVDGPFAAQTRAMLAESINIQMEGFRGAEDLRLHLSYPPFTHVDDALLHNLLTSGEPISFTADLPQNHQQAPAPEFEPMAVNEEETPPAEVLTPEQIAARDAARDAAARAAQAR